jgi:opine dehydrogenase
MQIAVLGGGHGCYAAAADMSEAGHDVRFWRRDAAAFAPVLESRSVTVKDARGRREVPIARPTTDLAEAVDGAELVLIPLPAIAQPGLFAHLAPLMRDGQVVYMPPASFGSYMLVKAARDAGNGADFVCAETGTLPWLCRKHGPAEVAISVRATRLPTGCFPAKHHDHAFEVIARAFPVIEPLEDALSGALMNAGPVIHPPLIMMNAGPLEHFDAWDIHNEGTQPSIRRTTDALDGERIAIREALGYKPPHFPLADHYDDDRDEWMYGNSSHEKLTDSGDWREHIVLTEHRYMLEDVETGLALMCSCADFGGVDAPVAKGLLAIGGAICGRDFRRTGRTLTGLGLAGMAPAELHRMLHDGI